MSPATPSEHEARTARRVRVEVPAPWAEAVTVGVRSAHDERCSQFHSSRDEHGRWSVEFDAADGDTYWLHADGDDPLLDPACSDVVLTPSGFRSAVRGPWPKVERSAEERPTDLVVYEMHVKGLGRTFRGCIEHLDHIVSTGATVIELMPVHPFDDSDNYWGYMPLVWGAVHRGYASDPERAPEELTELVAAAHERGLQVWIDVVFNHTGEGGDDMPVLGMRGLDRLHFYRQHDGALANDSGCGNDVDPSNAFVRDLVIQALDRYADLGIDGFRFDLASLLTRDGGELVQRITAWGAVREVTLVAEPWDLASYQVGAPEWPAGWLQWNDRFRDDVRGFLRAEPGLVPAIVQRVQGSPDLFGGRRDTSLNFVTAHDGLTMHDLTSVSSDRHRSWDCGADLRLQQLKNHFAMLLLSAGSPMWVMGDEFARTQSNHVNPYNVDGPLTWVDWSRAREWGELTDFVRRVVALRRAHPPADFHFHGVEDQVDVSFESRSVAWSANGLYVMVNAWWEPLRFGIHEPGQWDVVLRTVPVVPLVSVTGAWPAPNLPGVLVPARSIAILEPRPS